MICLCLRMAWLRTGFREREDACRSLPQIVRECCWGEAVTAVVVLKEGAEVSEAALLEKVRERLSPFKCPKRILFTSAMPKTATGKVQKGKLRAEYAGVYEERAPG